MHPPPPQALHPPRLGVCNVCMLPTLHTSPLCPMPYALCPTLWYGTGNTCAKCKCCVLLPSPGILSQRVPRTLLSYHRAFQELYYPIIDYSKKLYSYPRSPSPFFPVLRSPSQVCLPLSWPGPDTWNGVGWMGVWRVQIGRLIDR